MDSFEKAFTTYPYDSLKWFKYNCSLYYPLIIQHTGNENTETYQVEVILI